MDDSWNRFWERLIIDWVSVVVVAFIATGVWFGITSFLGARDPALAARLAETSAKLGVPWLLGIAGGLVWGFVRARAASTATGARR